MTRIKTALVIGGGIAGPVAALALRKAGIEATVYEAYDAAAIDAGAMLTVAPNGLAALDVVGLADAVRAAGRDLHAMVMEKGSGNPMMTVAALPGLPPSCTILRRELSRVIHEGVLAVGIDVEEGPGTVTAKVEDGSTATADILIGADGIHSIVRTLIDADAPDPQCTGLMSFGFGDFTADGRLSDGGRGPIDTMHFAFGRKSFCAEYLICAVWLTAEKQ